MVALLALVQPRSALHLARDHGARVGCARRLGARGPETRGAVHVLLPFFALQSLHRQLLRTRFKGCKNIQHLKWLGLPELPRGEEVILHNVVQDQNFDGLRLGRKIVKKQEYGSVTTHASGNPWIMCGMANLKWSWMKLTELVAGQIGVPVCLCACVLALCVLERVYSRWFSLKHLFPVSTPKHG